MINAFRQVWETGNPLYLPAKIYKDSKYNNYYENRIFKLDHNKIVTIYNDVTERVNLENKLMTSEELYRELVEKQTDLIVKTDVFGRLLFVSPSYCKLFGKNADEIVGKEYTHFIHEDDLARVESAVSEMIKPPHSCSYEERVNSMDGFRLIMWECKAILNESGNIIEHIRTGRDITEKRKWEENIIYLNSHDTLTGLYNKTFFNNEVRHLDTKENLPISIIIGDINGLKLTNDLFGHSEGDKLLLEVAKTIKGLCRKGDILARTGGDEFSIIFPRTSTDIVAEICNNIYKHCEKYELGINSDLVFSSISLGYSSKTDENESIDKALKEAEGFMYRRKLLERKSKYSSILTSIKTTMYEKSHETEEHENRLVELSKMVGIQMKFTEQQLNELSLAATLHDIGKMSVDDNILRKKGKLTENEWIEIKKHPEVGYRIAMACPELIPIADYILSHHESWDGSGYPQGLKGENIPLISRIVTVVDAFDAMTQDRPYRKAMSVEKAINEIICKAGTQFDPLISKVFVEVVKKI